MPPIIKKPRNKEPHLKKEIKFSHTSTKIQPKRLEKQFQYSYFNIDYHKNVFGINKAFNKKITEKTKILEIGAGSGRFADYLLRKTKLESKNLDLLDSQFKKGDLPYLKSLIWNLQKKGKINLIQGNMYDYKLNKKYDYIFVTSAIFTLRSPEIINKIIKNIGKAHTVEQSQLKLESLNVLVNNLHPALNLGGEIRLNYMPKNIIKMIEEQIKFNPILKKYKIEDIVKDGWDGTNGTALSLRKIKE